MIYGVAFGYGGILFDATQYWYIGRTPTFRLPGLTWDDYVRLLISFLELSACVFLFFPFVRYFRLSLAPSEPPRVNEHRFSTKDFVSWLALWGIVLLLFWILTLDIVPESGFNVVPAAQAFAGVVVLFLYELVAAPIVIFQLLAWRRGWRSALLVLIVGGIVNYLAWSLMTVIACGISETAGCCSVRYSPLVTGWSLQWFVFGGLSLWSGLRLWVGRSGEGELYSAVPPADSLPR